MDSGIFFQENIFSNHLLRDKIFSFLSGSDLRNCSLISKDWLSHTRKFLHSHRPCMLKLVLKDTDKLAAALEKLENSSEMLFNGVYLDLDFFEQQRVCYNGYCTVRHPFLEEIIKPILHDIFLRIPMKSVVTDRSCVTKFHSEGWHSAKWHSRKILRFCLDLLPVEQIENLKIYDTENNYVNEKWNFAFYMSGQGRTFSKLKKLDIYMRLTNSASLAKFLENFPVLREWSHDVSPQELEWFIEAKKEYLVKSLELGWCNAFESNLMPWQRAHVFLRQVKIYLPPNPEFVQLVWHVLRTSKASLQKVEIGFDFFWPLVRTGVYPLNNVNRVEICSWNDGENTHEFIRKTVQSDVDTRRIFPNAADGLEFIGA